ncbi:GGDEF domain-containing protein [Candidatus Nitrotoga sp. M5]|uniref:GGDEF domain-containing protein n=1 Tax=Candidatus Nitrotoga sp. M5 TaxID=2890409 RepID=UPI001EF503C7|nr:GGDEF domain-containing protein [Candidatus Nitrotoga sp. M5]CAH1387777.1 Diguanylate cyclase [Candidatus Nitrotoga sp. M5]
MNNDTLPSQIARKTLSTLAERKIAPTPENYTLLYHELSGISVAKSSDKALISKAQSLEGSTGDELGLEWPKLISDLLTQMDASHKGVTLTRKKQGVGAVLSKFNNDSNALFTKLQKVITSWGISAIPSSDELIPPILESEAAKNITSSNLANLPDESIDNILDIKLVEQLRELLAQHLECTHCADPDLKSEIQFLAQQTRTINDFDQASKLHKQLRKLWVKLESRSKDNYNIQEGLLRLFRLIVENVGELVTEDKWLHDQIHNLQEIIEHPINKHTISVAERNLRSTIIKQSSLKQNMIDAKITLKSLMTTFIDRLSEIADKTGEYHTKMEGYSLKVGQADNISELSRILDEIMQDTRNIQASSMRSHEELISTRQQANIAEERVKRLEQELEHVSELVREDQLTGALNRRGLDDVLDREIKRAERQQTPISIALLDIDNFKQLNDSFGHQAGDKALIHLTQVVKNALRPTDEVARYGGEEFLIILIDTSLEKAMATITRLQRELTKNFFLHNNERQLITFSAGVALHASGDDPESTIGRADGAMYKAKRAGKNRVFVAD